MNSIIQINYSLYDHYLCQEDTSLFHGNKLCSHIIKTRKEGVMKNFKFFKKFTKDTEGATMIEYAVLASLIAVISIGAITTVGTKVNTTFNTVGTSLN